MSVMVNRFAFESSDGLLSYQDTGNTGPALVLLHAGFLDSSMFDAQLPVLGRRHRVIAPDARGHGESGNATRPFRQSDDVAALLRHLDLTSVVIAGVSMGAMTAVEVAVEYPDLVAGLVVSGRAIGEPDYRDAWSKDLAQTQADALAQGDLAAWLDAFVLWSAGPARHPTEVDAALVGNLRRMATRTLAKHVDSRQNFHVPVPDVALRAPLISAPVLALDGAFDSPDLIATVDRLLDAVPQGRRTMIEGAGHFPNMEQPTLYNGLVEQFAASLAAA